MVFHSIVAVFFCGLLFVGTLCAEEPALATDTLPEVTVVDSAVITTPGSSVLDRETLQTLPQGDGAITDLLKVLPGIQFSEVDNSSLTGGEILPAEISISGGRVYDNNFMIDGVGNNSLLDPTADNPASSTTVPGHSQELFLDTSLIDTISIYRSNISARYSGFSGGVVDALTRDPADVFAGQISGRTTRSEWTSFHVDRDEEEDFAASEDADRQPEFRKYYGNVNVDVPLTETIGVLLSYSRTYSQIPLWNFDEEHKQYRDMENLFVKYLYRPTDRTVLRLSYLSTPYEGEYFRDDVKDSNYTIQGGGWSVSANLEHQFSFANAEFILAVRNSENSRRSPENYFNYKVTPSVDWGEKYSRKGGYGDVETDQETLTAASHFEWRSFTLMGIQHEWKSGLTLERTVADYNRSNASNSAWKISDQVVCDGDSVYCIADEQYAYSKVVYPKDKADAEISFVDLYLEDTLTWGRLSVRPGVHLGYNDFTKSTDYAARSAVFYDVFADGATIFSAGANRYYGKTFLTYALNEEKQLLSRWTRSLNADNTLTPWVEKKRTRFAVQRVSDLDTPYVDEWSVGLEQDMLGGRLTLAYIDRNGENQLSTEILDRDENGYTYSEWNNNGESRHKEVIASWERQWQKHYIFVDATWQDSQSTNEDYDEVLALEDLDELVWYNGHTTSLINLPRADYNREWSANLIYSVSLPYGFSFTNITRYRSGYAAISDTKENHELPDGETIDIYDDISYPSTTTFDWKLEWECSLANTQTLTISADVTNVFNRKLYTGVEGEYQMGRQLWVGMEYTF